MYSSDPGVGEKTTPEIPPDEEDTEEVESESTDEEKGEKEDDEDDDESEDVDRTKLQCADELVRSCLMLVNACMRTYNSMQTLSKAEQELL